MFCFCDTITILYDSLSPGLSEYCCFNRWLELKAFPPPEHDGPNSTFSLYSSNQFSIFASSCDIFRSFSHWMFYSSSGNIPNNYDFKNIVRSTFLCALIFNS